MSSLRSRLESILQVGDVSAELLRMSLRVALDEPDLSPADSAKLTGLWLDTMIALQDAEAKIAMGAADPSWSEVYKARAELLERLGAMPHREET